MHVCNDVIRIFKRVAVILVFLMLFIPLLSVTNTQSLEFIRANYECGLLIKLSDSGISSVKVINDTTFVASSENTLYVVYVNSSENKFEVWNKTLLGKINSLTIGGYGRGLVAVSTNNGEAAVLEVSTKKLKYIRELVKVSGHKANIIKTLLDGKHGILLVLDSKGLLYVYNIYYHGRLEIGFKGIHNNKLVEALNSTFGITNITSISISDVVLKTDYYECKNSYCYNCEYTLIKGVVSTTRGTYPFLAILNFTNAPFNYSVLYISLLPSLIEGPIGISGFLGRDILLLSYVSEDTITWNVLKKAIVINKTGYELVEKFTYYIPGISSQLLLYYRVNSVYTIIGCTDGNIYMFNITTDTFGEKFNFKLEWCVPLEPLTEAVRHVNLIWAWRRLEHNIMGFVLASSIRKTQLITFNCGKPLWLQEHGLPMISDITSVATSTTGNLIVYGLSDGKVFVIEGLKSEMYTKGLPEYFEIKVKVMLNETTPIPEAEVELLNALNKTLMKGITNERGEAFFYVSRGTYYIRVFDPTLGEVVEKIETGFRESVDPIINFELFHFTVKVLCKGDPYGIGFGAGPVPKVKAVLIPLKKGLPRYEGISDEEGIVKFTIAIVDKTRKTVESFIREGPYRLYLTLPDGRTYQKDVYINRSMALNVSIPARLERLVIKIIDKDTGKPVYPVRLVIRDLLTGVEGKLIITQDNSTLKIPGGNYELDITVKNYEPAIMKIHVPGIVVISLTPVKYKLTIEAVDEGGKPLKGFHVLISTDTWRTSKSTTTNSVTFLLKPGIYKVKAFKSGMEPASTVVELTENTKITITFKYPRYKLIVKVLDKSTLEPVDAKVEVVKDTKVITVLKPPFTAITLPSGIYIINVIPSEPYGKKTMKVILNSDKEVRVLLSRRPYILRVIVRDEEGKPVQGAEIQILNAESITGKTDKKGSYAINLPRDEYTIKVSYNGYAPETKKIYLDHDVLLEFKLKPTLQTIIFRTLFAYSNYLIIPPIIAIIVIVFLKFIRPRLRRRKEVTEEELFEELYAT